MTGERNWWQLEMSERVDDMVVAALKKSLLELLGWDGSVNAEWERTRPYGPKPAGQAHRVGP
jgi:hypothetical protein